MKFDSTLSSLEEDEEKEEYDYPSPTTTSTMRYIVTEMIHGMMKTGTVDLQSYICVNADMQHTDRDIEASLYCYREVNVVEMKLFWINRFGHNAMWGDPWPPAMLLFALR